MIRGFWVSSLTSLVAALITIKVVLHKRGLCNRIAGWGRGKRQVVGWGTDKLTGGRSRRSTGHKMHKKHGTPIKLGRWVGRMRSISTLLPSLWSVLAPDISSLSLNLLFPSTLRQHSMLIWPHYLNGRFMALWVTSRPSPSWGRCHNKGH